MTENKPVNILLTGGAGFIGSHILDRLLSDKRVGKVRVLDNFSTGKRENLAHVINHPDVELFEGDIRSLETCRQACREMHLICHQAALGSVPRSIKDPLTSHDVNVNGSLYLLQSAVEQGIKRIVFAASSSTYGDSPALPKKEDVIGKPLSPYAVTKYVNELYAGVYALVYGLEYIGLRYFNVFGPRQDPSGPYAAVIPLFMQAAREHRRPLIHGDGLTSRDFTYVDNAVDANLLALFTHETGFHGEPAVNQIYNVACGEQHSLNDLWKFICAVSGCTLDPEYGSPRQGDVRHSLADITKIKLSLGYRGDVLLPEGLHRLWSL